MDTILKPLEITKELVQKVTEELVEPESQITIHCLFEAQGTLDSFIRIWPSTFLFDNQSSYKSELVHVEKISLYPKWMLIPAGAKHYFSLIFCGLPKSCVSFDLVEQIPQSGGFEVRNIARNEIDVYYINI